MMKIIFPVLFLFCFFDMAAQKNKPKKATHSQVFKLWNYDSICTVIHNNPCLGLRLLSDSALFESHVDYKLASIMWQLYGKTTAISHYFHCDPIPAVSYLSINMGKSIYKMDVLLWMRYYGCPDSSVLQKKHYGEFTESERNTINSIYEYNLPGLRDLDTTILWK